MKLARTLLLAAFALAASTAFAQTIKIGFITSYSGLNGNLGPYMERAVRLYIKEHQKELPPGVKIELITRDDTGPNPDKAKQLAQELIVRERVNLLAGVIFTPNAMAIAPLATEAKVPFVIMNAGTAVITTRSPYIARTSFTLWQSSFPLGTWAAKKYKTAYTLVSDFGPGHDAETAFTQAFKEGGGNVVAGHEGVLDKYIGDGLMVVFGAPVAQPDHASRAVITALEMQAALQTLNLKRAQRGDDPIAIGIGVNTGIVISGNLGSIKRLEFTVVGDTVNLAARLESRAGQGQILIGQATFDLVKEMVLSEPLGPMPVKGKAEPVEIWLVKGLKPRR